MSKCKILLKVILLTMPFLVALLATGCTNWIAESKQKEKERIILKSMTTPTPPVLIAFEKICLNNENSPEDMLKAAKVYGVTDIKTSARTYKKYISLFKYEKIPGTFTTMKTLDNTMRISIYAPEKDCSVTTISGKNAIVDVLLSPPHYYDNEKIIDIQLGMILFKKYGSSIQTSQMVKASTSNVTSLGPSFSRPDGGKTIRYFLTPGSNYIDLRLTEETD